MRKTQKQRWAELSRAGHARFEVEWNKNGLVDNLGYHERLSEAINHRDEANRRWRDSEGSAMIWDWIKNRYVI